MKKGEKQMEGKLIAWDEEEMNRRNGELLRSQ